MSRSQKHLPRDQSETAVSVAQRNSRSSVIRHYAFSLSPARCDCIEFEVNVKQVNASVSRLRGTHCCYKGTFRIKCRVTERRKSKNEGGEQRMAILCDGVGMRNRHERA